MAHSGNYSEKTSSSLIILAQEIIGIGVIWAQGHIEFGRKYHSLLVEKIRKEVEKCDSLEGFMLLHSIGGGTGSGFGTYTMKVLKDHYPDVFKFSICVIPSSEDDVLVSPYNSMFSLNELINNADVVLPVDNQSLFNIVSKIEASQKKVKETLKYQKGIKEGSAITENAGSKKKMEYDKENSIVANMINNLTAYISYKLNEI
jgi:tubulin epsilon